jgi:fructokinase
MSRDSRRYGAVEAGGTKFVCAIGDESGALHAEARFATAEPESTLAQVAGFLRDHNRELGSLSAIGVASFGPLVLDPSSARYGCIDKTPKPHWSNFNIVGRLAQQFSCPIGFDTDVNAAALAEHRWGAGRNVANLVYITVGTGIGGGVLVDGAPLHGLMHPEIGHVQLRRHPLDANFGGVCPFHGDCLEGLASGTAVRARTGTDLECLDAAHSQWQIEADYLGQLCAQLVLMLSPQMIIMGGGVLSQERLLPMIRERTQHWLAGYVNRQEILDRIAQYIVAPALGARAGVLGALNLALVSSPG